MTTHDEGHYLNKSALLQRRAREAAYRADNADALIDREKQNAAMARLSSPGGGRAADAQRRAEASHVDAPFEREMSREDEE